MMILPAEDAEESRILYPIFEDNAGTVANIPDLQPPTDSQQVVHLNADTTTTTGQVDSEHQPQPTIPVTLEPEPLPGPSMSPDKSERQLISSTKEIQKVTSIFALQKN